MSKSVLLILKIGNISFRMNYLFNFRILSTLKFSGKSYKTFRDRQINSLVVLQHNLTLGVQQPFFPTQSQWFSSLFFQLSPRGLVVFQSNLVPGVQQSFSPTQFLGFRSLVVWQSSSLIVQQSNSLIVQQSISLLVYQSSNLEVQQSSSL